MPSCPTLPFLLPSCGLYLKSQNQHNSMPGTAQKCFIKVYQNKGLMSYFVSCPLDMKDRILQRGCLSMRIYNKIQKLRSRHVRKNVQNLAWENCPGCGDEVDRAVTQGPARGIVLCFWTLTPQAGAFCVLQANS